MNFIKPTELFKISVPGNSTCLSIYANSSKEMAQLLGDAKRLAFQDLSTAEAAALFLPITTYLRTHREWTRPMAFFVTKGFAGMLALPFKTKNLSVVALSFHVKPILKWLQRERPYFLLHLKDDRASLYKGTMSDLQRVKDFMHVALSDIDGIYHDLDSTLYTHLQREQHPLLLAGNPRLVSTFKEMSHNKLIVEQTMKWVDEFETMDNLHKKSIELLEPFLHRQESQYIRQYWNAKLRQRTSSNLNEIVDLAIKGGIKHLFINEKMNVWGRINYKTSEFTYHPRQLDAKDDDVLDDIAELVLFHRGTVTVLPPERMPDSQAAVAILRPKNEYMPKRSIRRETSVTETQLGA